MINPVQTMIPQQDGSDRYVIIEPVLIKDSAGAWGTNGEYKIYKDAFGDETRLFTEPLERYAPSDELPDEQNPDYLGRFIFKDREVSHFEGDVLNVAEQAYLAVFIESYHEPDV